MGMQRVRERGNDEISLEVGIERSWGRFFGVARGWTRNRLVQEEVLEEWDGIGPRRPRTFFGRAFLWCLGPNDSLSALPFRGRIAAGLDARLRRDSHSGHDCNRSRGSPT